MTKARIASVTLDGHRSIVGAAPLDVKEKSVWLVFIEPLRPGDIKDSKALPRASARRNHGRLKTDISLPREAAEALYVVLHDILDKNKD
jgi:hypothetical protein